MMSDLPLSIEELIRACVAGERWAWEEFIVRFDKLIAGVVFRTAEYWGCGSSESLKDMMQEVLHVAWPCCCLVTEDPIFGFHL